jgi:hypothetical protein
VGFEAGMSKNQSSYQKKQKRPRGMAQMVDSCLASTSPEFKPQYYQKKKKKGRKKENDILSINITKKISRGFYLFFLFVLLY